MTAVTATRQSNPFIGLAGHVLRSRPSSSASTSSSDHYFSPSDIQSYGGIANSTCSGYHHIISSVSSCSKPPGIDCEVNLSNPVEAEEDTRRLCACVAETTPKSHQRKCRRKSSGLKVNTVGCNGKSAKDCYAIVCEELGWKEVDLEVKGKETTKDNTIFCVTQSKEVLERLPRLGKHSWVSRYLGCPELCDKGNFARMCAAVQCLCEPEELAFNPKTWVLPEQYAELRLKLEKSRKTFIVKPEDGSQGDGIFLIRGIRDLEIKMTTGNRAAVVQRYIEKPLLLRGMKFDLRMYVCLVGGSEESPPRAFLCKEGLARFCTEKYEEPAQTNMHKCMGHLTNYSLNKRSDKFEHAGETMESVFDPGSTASKRPLTAALAQMEMECHGFDRGAFYDSVAAVVLKSVAVMAPALTAFSRSHGGGEMRSFQVLGFDIILDRDFVPYLLEINNSPSLCIDECLPLDYDRMSLEDLAVPTGGRTREKDKVCRCMDMAQPHFHQQALVDVVVKKTAVGGAFLLLEQLRDGVEEPWQEDYISVDVSGDPLFDRLLSIENLFYRCGGARKAFTSAALRRNLGHICSKGALEKHDLDTLSQKFRFTKFGSHEPATRPEALRLFDFLELLKQVGTRAFPGVEPSQALDMILQRI